MDNNRYQVIALLAAILAATAVSVCLMENVVVRIIAIVVAIIWFGFAMLFPTTVNRTWWHELGMRLLPAAVFTLMTWNHIPLKLAFRFCRADFENVATAVKLDKPPKTPFWIGPFKINVVGTNYGGCPYLATSTEGEISGFVPESEGEGFNCWSWVTLNDHWSYIDED